MISELNPWMVVAIVEIVISLVYIYRLAERAERLHRWVKYERERANEEQKRADMWQARYYTMLRGGVKRVESWTTSKEK